MILSTNLLTQLGPESGRPPGRRYALSQNGSVVIKPINGISRDLNISDSTLLGNFGADGDKRFLRALNIQVNATPRQSFEFLSPNPTEQSEPEHWHHM